MKNFLRSTISRIFRFVLAIAIIYVCMVFYLMLSERRIAFPKAIKHKEAREAIADTTMVQKVSCKISDDIILEGFFAKKRQTSLQIFNLCYNTLILDNGKFRR